MITLWPNNPCLLLTTQRKVNAKLTEKANLPLYFHFHNCTGHVLAELSSSPTGGMFKNSRCAPKSACSVTVWVLPPEHPKTNTWNDLPFVSSYVNRWGPQTRDLGLPFSHIPFLPNCCGEHWTPCLPSLVASLQQFGKPVQVVLKLQPKMDTSFSALLGLSIK